MVKLVEVSNPALPFECSDKSEPAPNITLADGIYHKVPVGTVNTTASASFFNVMSDVLPWPVKIKPSAAV